METNEIGLAAHIGTDARIQLDKFSQIEFMVAFLLTVAFAIIFVGICFYSCKYFKERRDHKNRSVRINFTNSKPSKGSNKYLPSSHIKSKPDAKDLE